VWPDAHVEESNLTQNVFTLRRKLGQTPENEEYIQTIARANRVWKEKQNGLIVDYVGVFRNLQKALAIYGTGQGESEPGASPVHKKDELVIALRTTIASTTDFCIERNVNPATIQQARGCCVYG